jgi:DNA polymerase-1
MTTPTAAPLRAGTWDSPIGVIVADRGRGLDRRYAVGPASQMRVTDRAGLVSAVRDEEAKAPLRWVLWAAGDVAPDLVAEGLRLARAWDVSEAHRLLHGGWEAHPGMSWAAAHGIPLDEVPTPPTGDLFEFATTPTDDGGLIRSDGHLRPDAVHGDWVDAPDRLLAWAQAALDTAAAQRDRAASLGPRVVSTIHSESAAALLCVDLAHDGLPLDRGAVEGLIAEAAGPRPDSLADELAARALRDKDVFRHVPGRESTDLRNPAQVKDLLAAVGVQVPNTRKWVLEDQRAAHPVVGALLDWRKRERIATTYGYRWLDAHVGTDDRLRGQWTACDGAGGRMTADNGLHNLPAAMRPAVAAAPGHVFVRADLGQIEPRVLAVVSGDRAFAEATLADDLYAPVAQRLGAERAVAKIAVLAAMYGQRSGAAGEALKGLERAYPVAMAHLDRAYAVGVRGGDLRTFGGRLLPTGRFLTGAPIGTNPPLDSARGRFARNAVIQGAAAELFKAWAVTVRALGRPLGAEIVLCLHDELLVHVPEDSADDAAALVDQSLVDAARRWSGGAPVRFVADTSVIRRWSEAK